MDKGEVSSWELVTLGSVDTIRRKEERKGEWKSLDLFRCVLYY